MNRDIAAVIPAYNESSTIADIVCRTRRHLQLVIVVDDGSDDDTAAQLRDLPVTVLRHPSNQGKGASLWSGIRYALERGAGAVITLDADGQHSPEEIPRLLAANQRHRDQLIIAARLGGREQVPRLRRFANRTADFWIGWAAGYPLHDTQSGFRLYPASLLKTVQAPHDRRHGFVFESEILIEAARMGYYPVTISVDAIYHRQARPSYYRPFLDTMAITRMVAWKLISRRLYLKGLLRSRGLLRRSENYPTPN